MSGVDKSEIYYGVGMERLEHQDYPNALKYFEMSLEIKKRSITAARVYECLIRMNRVSEARKYIELAFMMNTSSDKIATQYAAVLMDSKEIKKATKILENVLLRNPSYAPAQKLMDSL